MKYGLVCQVKLFFVKRVGKFVKNKFHIPFASVDYLDMLNMSPLDGVVVASPHFAHFENAKASLEKGCHVLIEKPMTINSNDNENK